MDSTSTTDANMDETESLNKPNINGSFVSERKSKGTGSNGIMNSNGRPNENRQERNVTRKYRL